MNTNSSNRQKNNEALQTSSPQRIAVSNKSESSKNGEENIKLASNSFIRTSTLPRRFKQKFLNKYNHSSTSATADVNERNSAKLTPSAYSIISVNSQSSSISNSSSCSSSSSSCEIAKNNQISTKTEKNLSNDLKLIHSKQLQDLDKFVEKFLKSIKYLEQIILKKKYEIIASSITAILETVLDIYNVIQSFDSPIIANNAFKVKNTDLITYSSAFKNYRLRINKSLANLIKWSDSILFLNSTKIGSNELFNETHLHDSTKMLINHLNKSIKLLVKYLKKFFCSQEMWMDQYIDADMLDAARVFPDTKLDISSSTSSTSSLNEVSGLNEKLNATMNSNQNPESFVSSSNEFNSKLISESDPSLEYSQFETGAIKTETNRIVDSQNGITITQTTVKSTDLAPNSQITQTTTLTTTTSTNNAKNLNLCNNNDIDPLFNIDSGLVCNPVRLSAFIDLDRLVLELSSLSTNQTFSSESETCKSKKEDTAEVLLHPTAGFTNEQCNYLVSQFQTFAKDFKKKEILNDSNSDASTIDRNTDGSITSVESKKNTIYSNTVFKHNNTLKLSTQEQLHSAERKDQINEDGKTLSKIIDYQTMNKEKFKETSILFNDKSLDEILINSQVSQSFDQDKDPVQTFTSLFDDPETAHKDKKTALKDPAVFSTKLDDSVDNEEDDDGNINAIIFGANKLNPNFLLIDEDDDDDVCENDGDRLDKTNIRMNKKTKKNFLIDDDEVNGYNDKIELDTSLIESKKPNNDSLLSTWSLSSSSSNPSSSSSFSLFSNRQRKDSEKNNIVSDKKKSISTISLNSRVLPCANSNEKNSPPPEIESEADKKNDSSIFLTPGSAQNTNNSQSSSSTSSSFSSLSCQNAAQKPNQSLSANLLVESTISTEKSFDFSVLNLLDVAHLIEYQTNSSANTSTSTLLNSTTNSVLSSNSSSVDLNSSSNHQNTNILRGGHIDALIVLATSAQSGVSGAQASCTKSIINNSMNNLLSPNNLNKYSRNHRSEENITKNNFLFQEAFLTTYRTIIEPIDLINKLIHRYRYFSKYPTNGCSTLQHADLASIKNTGFEKIDDKFDFNRVKTSIKNNKLALSAAKNSLALLVRVLDDLGNELNEKIVEKFADFVYELLLDDELQLARLLRKKLITKLDKKRLQEQEKETENLHKLSSNISKKTSHLDFGDHANVKIQITPYLNSFTKRTQNLLDFKSVDLAEQMTLIDLNLFLKIELSEVLLWSTKQNEEFSPNLIQFTEHFNKISYWARSRILEHENPKEREKYIIKFLKIMKHLRKMNNFNSYLSILSAVDSGPIQRLDWSKNITDNIKELSVLIDPKCGFKSLREAVNEAQPPCIPHIGLILQDLTILHIANSDYLPSGNCNFWKRWQQFNILERLRYFRRCNYEFKKNQKVEQFFNNFEDFFNEEAQYSLSEQLKPRSKH